mgnify:CR=1 FL=1
MSSLSGRFDRGIGLIVNVGLSPAGVFPPPNNAQVQFFPALIDTGATSTCITSSVADKIGLKPIGKRQMATVGPFYDGRRAGINRKTPKSTIPRFQTYTTTRPH